MLGKLLASSKMTGPRYGLPSHHKTGLQRISTEGDMRKSRLPSNSTGGFITMYTTEKNRDARSLEGHKSQSPVEEEDVELVAIMDGRESMNKSA